MTQAEWEVATDPGPMLVFLRGEPVERKQVLFGSEIAVVDYPHPRVDETRVRQFAVMCCARVADMLSPDRVSRVWSVVRSLGCRDVTEFPYDAGLRALDVAERYAVGAATSEDLFEAEKAAREVALLAAYYSGAAGDPYDPDGWPRPYDWDLRATGEAASAVWAACGPLINIEQVPSHVAQVIAILRSQAEEPDAMELAAQAEMLRKFVPTPFQK